MNSQILSQIGKLNNIYFRNSETKLKDLKKKDVKIFYIAKKGKVVGYCILKWPAGCVNMEYIGVVKEYRKKHIGTKLVKKAIKWCARNGCPLFTYASIYNTVSINMLVKCGFLVEYCTTRWVFFRIG